jgi:hypothetical protein
LEDAIEKDVVPELEQSGRVTAHGAELLLDWFDKVRVGLWINALQLLNNPYGIAPNFHVSTRQRKDRVLFVGRTTRAMQGLYFSPIEDPVFHAIPSYFCLAFNQLVFVNASFDGLMGVALGLPSVRLDPFREAYPDCGEFIKPGAKQYRGWRPEIPPGFLGIAQCALPMQVGDRASSACAERWLPDSHRSRIHFADSAEGWSTRGDDASVLVPRSPADEYDKLGGNALTMLLRLRRHVTRCSVMGKQPNHRWHRAILITNGELGYPQAGFHPDRRFQPVTVLESSLPP